MAIVSFTNYRRKQTRGMMRTVMRYTMQEKKTLWEDKRLVSGVNCLTETVCGDFMTTKRLHHKEDGTLFYHMVQSFPAGEAVDPVTAHAAALELANYFSDCEVLVCTHVDRDHIHSHFIINSVQLENGKKLHIAKEQLQELRQRNDEVCAQFSLPVFQKQQAKKVKSVSNAEYHTALKGESWKLRLANTIDECMKYASDREEFISLMESEGYTVRWERGRKYITYTTPEGMKCRDSKLHEEKYWKEVMEHEFRIRAKFDAQRTAEIAAGVEADEPTEYTPGTHVHHAPVSDGGRSAGADAEGERCLLGAANPAGDTAQLEIPHRPDGGTKFTDRDSKDPDKVDFTYRTGWEAERKAYLQMAGMVAGLRPAGGHQVDRSGAGFDRGGAGDGVRNRNSRQQYSKSLSLMPLQVGADLMLALCALADDPTDDPEEIQRRIAARNDGEILGFTLGVMVSFVIVLNAIMEKKLQQEAQQESIQQEEPQQTMGGL